ncbi:hypothetical protein ABPG72_022227 [Tetrahymena utriculariae]
MSFQYDCNQQEILTALNEDQFYLIDYYAFIDQIGCLRSLYKNKKSEFPKQIAFVDILAFDNKILKEINQLEVDLYQDNLFEIVFEEFINYLGIENRQIKNSNNNDNFCSNEIAQTQNSIINQNNQNNDNAGNFNNNLGHDILGNYLSSSDSSQGKQNEDISLYVDILAFDNKILKEINQLEVDLYQDNQFEIVFEEFINYHGIENKQIKNSNNNDNFCSNEIAQTQNSIINQNNQNNDNAGNFNNNLGHDILGNYLSSSDSSQGKQNEDISLYPEVQQLLFLNLFNNQNIMQQQTQQTQQQEQQEIISNYQQTTNQNLQKPNNQ